MLVDGLERGRGLVLVVDDEESIRALICAALQEELAVSTAEAANGCEALRMIGERRPALVILDITMPGLDGLEVMRRLRSDPVTASIPIIAVSAIQSAHKSVLRVSSDDSMEKPFDLDELLLKVDRLLPAPVPARKAA